MNNSRLSITDELKTKSGRVIYLTIGILFIIFSIFRYTGILESANLENYKVTIVAGLFFVGLVVIAIWGERDMKYWRRLALGLAFSIFMYALVTGK